VARQERGETFSVFDGIGSAPKGMQAAQAMCDILIKFYQEPERYQASASGILKLLLEGNETIYNWGFISNTDRPLGGCAGTVVWLYEDSLSVFHAGDTAALLIRDGETSQITQPHNMDDGAIYRYFSLGPNLAIETNQIPLEEFDRILLLSDGVTKAFRPIEAGNLVEGYNDISQTARVLGQRSQTIGSTDDITVLLIEIKKP